jgi:hypothetical protein
MAQPSRLGIAQQRVSAQQQPARLKASSTARSASAPASRRRAQNITGLAK